MNYYKIQRNKKEKIKDIENRLRCSHICKRRFSEVENGRNGEI